MSIKIMTAVWEMDLPDSEKILLLALADSANDEGECWPSMATLSKKCSKSDRTLQKSMRALCDKGHLSRNERPGRGVLYHIHPRNDVTPEAASPPKETTQTPEASSGDPRSGFGQTVKNPKEPARARGARLGAGKMKPAPAARPIAAPSAVPERLLEAHREQIIRQAFEVALSGQLPPWLARAGLKCGDLSDDGQVIGLTVVVPFGQRDAVERETGSLREIANRDTSFTVRWVNVEQTRALRVT